MIDDCRLALILSAFGDIIDGWIPESWPKSSRSTLDRDLRDKADKLPDRLCKFTRLPGCQAASLRVCEGLWLCEVTRCRCRCRCRCRLKRMKKAR